jgi:hypothetical protein
MDAGQRLSEKRPVSGIQLGHAARQGDCYVVVSGPATRRRTVIASGLLLLALALVVIYTGPNAFLSPIALVVVAAIGLAALLLQLRFRQDLPQIRSPFWLNILGLLCAMMALAADFLGMPRRTLEVVAFAAVVCFGISGSLILHALRRQRKAAE